MKTSLPCIQNLARQATCLLHCLFFINFHLQVVQLTAVIITTPSKSSIAVSQYARIIAMVDMPNCMPSLSADSQPMPSASFKAPNPDSAQPFCWKHTQLFSQLQHYLAVSLKCMGKSDQAIECVRH